MADEVQVPAHVRVRRREGRAFDLVVLDAEAIDQERPAVQHGIEQEGRRPEGLEELGRDDEASPEPGQRRALEASRGATPERLVARRGHGDEAEDRGHRCGRRGALEDARATEQRDVGGEGGEDDRDGTEDRPVEHHPMVAEPVGQDPEERGEDQLGQEERRREDADDLAVDTGRVRTATGRPGRTPASPRSGRC